MPNLMSAIDKIEERFWERLTPDGELERTSVEPESDEWTEMVGIMWHAGDRAVTNTMTAEAYADEGARRIIYNDLASMLNS